MVGLAWHFCGFVALVTAARLQPIGLTQFNFQLDDLEVEHLDQGFVSVKLSDHPSLRRQGEPSLPVIREAVVLPVEGEWQVVVTDVKTSVLPLQNRKVVPSRGSVPICAQAADVEISNVSGPAYFGQYPKVDRVLLEEPYTWRDVHGVVLQILPVIVDHTAGTMEVLTSCNIELVNTVAGSPIQAPKTVDQDFYGVYSFVYSNFHLFADKFVKAEKIGRTLIVHDSSFKSHAQRYADFVQQHWQQESVLLEASSSSDSIKSAIKTHYSEDASLAYVMIIGRNVPTPRGSSTQAECDNCYAMINGDTLDLFVGRLSGATSADITVQLDKFEKYISTSAEPWNEKAHGSCYPAPWDPSGYEQLFKDMMQVFGDEPLKFTQHEYVMSDTSGAGQNNLREMNGGIGVFGYIGHGSGTAWNTPSVGVRDVQSLTNVDKHFLSLDCSCDNGGFQSNSPSLAEALLTSKGGAVATMMSAPTIDTCCLDYLRAAPQVLASGKVTRMGPMFVASLAKAQVAAPDRARSQSYNVFADPALEIAFLASPSPPVPSPSPVPSPVPSPMPVPTPSGQCHAISAVVTDDWCTANCKAGFCPSDLCKCDSAISV